MSFPRYRDYKDSGIELLGKVPAHWQLKRFKRIFQERDARSVSGDEVLLSVSAYTGVSPRSELIDKGDPLSRAESLEGYKLCYRHDLVMNIMLAWNRGLAITQFDGIVSPAYSVFFIIDGTAPAFLNYLVRSDEYTLYFKAYSAGVIDSRLRLYPDTFGSLFCAIPSLEEQTKIAAFLDRETAKIDELVKEQQRLIELLTEKRQALISHAVMKGLNPDAPMKVSGIEWLGEIPEDWVVASVRRIVRRIEQGWSPECLGRPAEGNEWGIVKSGCVNRGIYEDAENKALPESLDPIPEYEIHVGDVLMCRASGSPELVGSTAFIEATRPRLMLSDKIFRIHLEPGIDRHFFVAAFNSRTMRSEIERAISGADGLANNLPQSAMKAFPIAVPPLACQIAIVNFLTTELTKMDALVLEATRAITLLQERRSALISAAVTGQIDVLGLVKSEAA